MTIALRLLDYNRTKMNRIFCLETEWDQTMHDLKKKSTVLPLLDFLENTINIEYTFRQVATESDFNY